MPPAAYILCTSPRSGSTLLCTLLRDSGVAGHPQSWFHRPSLEDWCRGLDLPSATPLTDIFTAATIKGRGGTNIFGLRLQRHSAPFFIAQLRATHPLATSDTAAIAAQFGPTKYIHLHRADKVAQAVSLVRAAQSGLWHRNADGSDLERTGQGQTPHYDPQAIAAERDALTTYDAEWEAWFAEQDIAPMRLTYDALAANPAEALHKTLAFLDLPIAGEPKPATAPLADAINADWITRFKADTAT
ncbi:Stf0 family sulfotransferase [uncultured Tateyamaria sp.]|uniref:Stf0 family sulfotransferase n=1 Tax=uncultured Tateyamaria sp. TaxID=455651 RepID=UPI00262FF626|nr:Stf0 family sulfotransferase [uncultured Tateyamaria sp.]